MFQYKGKFHAVDNVGCPLATPPCESRERTLTSARSGVPISPFPYRGVLLSTLRISALC